MDIALHYPSVTAPPVGVWWWDDGVRQHYLPGHAELARTISAPDVTCADEWHAWLDELRARTATDKVRTARVAIWSPVEFLLGTIAHWALLW